MEKIPPRLWATVTLLVAIFGCIGTVSAAVLPKIIEKWNTPTPNVQPTQIGVNFSPTATFTQIFSTSTPIPTSTFEPMPTPLPCSTNLTWEAQDGEVNGDVRIGRPDIDNSWSADVSQDKQGWFQIGPYTTQVNTGNHVAMWLLMIDDNSRDDFPIIRLEVTDFTTNQTVLASRKITRSQWDTTWTYQCFSVPFTLDESRIGDQLEFRIWWYGKAYIRQQRVAVE